MKKIAYQEALIIVIGLLLLPTSVRSGDFTLSGYTEAGKRSTADDYQEEGTDNDYAYRNYHLKLEQKISDRLSYDISSFVYDKKYSASDSLDNISRIFKTNWSYFAKKTRDKSLELGFDVNYKERRYEHLPKDEYDEIRVASSVGFDKRDLYAVDLALGIDNFDYLKHNQKDELKLFVRVGGKRYFLEKKLSLSGSYKLENTKQKQVGRQRTKQEILGGLDYIFDLPWIYKITAKWEWGARDTKDDEARDEDFDYKYWRYAAKTEHRISPKLKTDIAYEYFKKDYLSADLDHRGFYIRNSWDYEVLDDAKKRIGFGFGYEHKDVKYSLISGDDYRKETLGLDASYKKKKDWGVSLGLEQNFYDFSGLGNDKERTYVLLSGEKSLFEGDLVLSLDLKYRYTNYEQRQDSEQQAIRFSFEYRF